MSKPPTPSATVVVVRDGAAGLELLLLERNRDKSPWVFPGGKIDPGDREGAPDEDRAARRAAVREAAEEAGLALEAEALLPISRWITPAISPRRFDTLFFLAPVAARTLVRVDGGEIRSHRWLGPERALAAHHAHELRLAPPTFVSVHWLLGHTNVRSARASLSRPPLIVFEPRIYQVDEKPCILYPGDAGYEAGDPAREGPRHRLFMHGQWRYQREGC